MRQREVRHLQRAAKPPQLSVQWRRGRITAVTPLTVALGGSSQGHPGVHRLSSYSPAVGDDVAVLHWENDLIVIGKIV